MAQEEVLIFEESLALCCVTWRLTGFLSHMKAQASHFQFNQMDVKIHFLWCPLKEEVNVSQLDGFDDPDHARKNGRSSVCVDTLKATSGGDIHFPSVKLVTGCNEARICPAMFIRRKAEYVALICKFVLK
ncbi:hypothetical protein Tco_1083121 [Tanacetum coccineum]|uniref:Uncharacterized protein n=1 Tax=Tanacetum coccineum TaxID=301880 RepID=A0ABQ5I2B4_9ASTR